MAPKTLFIFGYGYCASALAKDALAAGWRVSGTARDADKRQAAAPFGITLVDFTDADGAGRLLSEATHVVCFIPPGRETGDVALYHHRAALMAAAKLEWLGYASTTGVYGDANGGPVDEDTLPMPATPRTRLRLEAEHAWAKLARARGLPLAILRLGGIYGPGRSALAQLRAGTARRIDKPRHLFNRVHVADVAGGMLHLAQAHLGGIFNLVDGAPSESRQVVEYAAEISGLPLPPLEPFEAAELSPMMREFYSANRQVGNAALIASGYALRYPDVWAGLAAEQEWHAAC